MNKTIGIIFTLGYIVLTYFLVLGLGRHGPGLIGYFATGYLVIAIIGLWRINFFVSRRDLKRKTYIFFFSGLIIAVLLVGAIFASLKPLVELEVYQLQRHAASTEVSDMKDEVLFSPKGNPIGIRLKYSMRFPDSNYFWESPTMSPDKYLDVIFWMNIANQTIEPPMIGTDPLKYEQGKIYNFTVDMIPNFVMQNVDKTKSCIRKLPVEYKDAFQKLIQNDEAVRFTIRVSGTEYSGVTNNTYSLKLFYDNAIKEGAFECKEDQTIYF